MGILGERNVRGSATEFGNAEVRKGKKMAGGERRR